MAARHGIEVIDPSGLESGADVADALRDLTDGRGPDAVVDAVGMEAHGSHVARAAQNLAGLLPDVAARKVFEKVGVDGLTVLHAAIDAVRRGGTVSVVGVYGGAVDPMPMMDMFDKQIQLRMGQCNVRRWTDVLLPLVEDERRPARGAGPGHSHRADRRGAADVQDVPGKDRRLHQGRHQTLTPYALPPRNSWSRLRLRREVT